MMTTDRFDMLQKVAAEAQPRAEWGRAACEGLDNEFLLWDLASTHARLERGLKEWFLGLWVNGGELDAVGQDDPLVEKTVAALRDFAAVEPVVDLEELRGRPLSAAGF